MSLIELATELSKTSEEVVRLQTLREEALQKVEAARLILKQEEEVHNEILSQIEATNAKVEQIQVQLRELIKPKENKVVEKAPVIDISGKKPTIRRRDRWSDSDSEDEYEDDRSSRSSRYYREAVKYSADDYTKKCMDWEQHKVLRDPTTGGDLSLTHSCYIPRIYVPKEVALGIIKDKLIKAGHNTTTHLDKITLVKKEDFGEFASYFLNGLTRSSKKYLVDKVRISYSPLKVSGVDYPAGYMIIGVPTREYYYSPSPLR